MTSGLFRKSIEAMRGYIPGEQPRESGWIKLNTNENPYPPSPQVVRAIQEAATSRLNIYPDALAWSFRKAAGKVLGVDPEWILAGNGSDEILTMIMRSFVDPGDCIAFPYPSYILYGTLAEIQGARFEHLPLDANWRIDISKSEALINASKIVFLPNPNSPSGHCWSEGEIAACRGQNRMLVLDEAYADFKNDSDTASWSPAMLEDRTTIVTRTLSKSYSLAGLRFGFGVAHPDLIEGLMKVKDSYNCDAISIAAATAAMEDQEWILGNIAKIHATKARVEEKLKGLGFDALPSSANFIWCRHESLACQSIYDQLRAQKILIRYMKFPGAEHLLGEPSEGLRISIGTDAEMDRFLNVIEETVQRG